VSLWGRHLLRTGTALAAAGMLVCGLAVCGQVIAPRSAEAEVSSLNWSGPDNLEDVQLRAVSCPTASFCMAIDDGGNAITWDGTSWSAPMTVSGIDGILTTVSCSSASFCMAADLSGEILTWDGTSWSAPAPMDPDNFEDGAGLLSCVSASFCFATGDGYVYKWSGGSWSAWNGTSWSTWTGSEWSASPVIIDSDFFWSLSCPTVSFCAAVDTSGNAYTWNGTSWSAPSSLNDQEDGLLSVSCASASFCMAVGDPGNAYTWNGTSWSAAGTNPFDAGGDPNSVSCPSASFCAAVDGAGRALTWDGTSWSAPTLIDQHYVLVSVSCASASSCAAVDQGGNAFTATATLAAPTPAVSVTDNSQGLSPGGNLTFTATVTGSGPIPTGTVTWTLTGPGSPTCADSTLSAGTATCTVSDAQAGAYTATANYAGDSDYGSASGTDDTAQVGSPAPAVSVTDNASSIPAGGTLIFTATVTGSGPTPTGTVTWTVTAPSGSTVPCSSTSGPAGAGHIATYTCSITSAVAGAYTATANYAGDSHYGPASGTGTANVSAARVTLSLSAAKATYGNEKVEKLSVTVAPAPRTGVVTISFGTTTVCSINLSAGKGSCSLSKAQLAAGTYSLVATYAGTQSAQKLLIVAKAASKTTLKLSATEVTYGHEQVEKLSVTVAGQSKGLVPTGTVTITESSTTICTISLTLGKGSCTLSATQLAAGRYSIIATYAASADFVGSASTRSALTVLR
jgi:Bacterial Ig-like domain (group 3)